MWRSSQAAYEYSAPPTQSFWCCTGTGMENHAKYGGEVHYHSADSLYVNLFIPSELDWAAKGVKVKLETRFPESDKVALAFTARQPVKLALNIRVPYWATSGVKVKVNGRDRYLQPVTAGPSSYITLDRTWKTGDRVEFVMPMSLRLEPTPDDRMWPPLCMARWPSQGKLGDGEYVKTVQHAADQRQLHGAPTVEAPVIVASADEQVGEASSQAGP